MAKILCRFLGVIFVLAGVVFFVAGDDADWYHNLLHFVTGVIALYFGFAGSVSQAKGFCLVSGAAYLAFGVLGMVMGDPAMNRMWHIGPLHLAAAEHGFHMVLGSILLAGGLLTRAGVPAPPRLPLGI